MARYLEIAAELRAAISNGEYPIGSTLPSEGDLVARYRVARGTVRQAIAQLEQDGVVATRQGARRVVLGSAPAQSFTEMQSFSMWAVSQGHVPSARVLRCEPGEATEQEAALLRVPPGESLVRLERLRLLDGHPTMVERTLYTGLVTELLLAMDLTTGSITEALTARGHVYAHAEHSIDAMSAGVADADLLGVRRGSPLLRMRRLSTSPTGVPLEWSDDRYRQDAITITVRNSMSINTLMRLSPTMA